MTSKSSPQIAELEKIENNVTIELFADYYSALPVAFVFANIMEAIYHGNFLEMFLFTMGMLGTDQLTHILKRLPYPKSLQSITSRPIGAKNTDILSRNGVARCNTPGFPSGHVATVTFFAVYRLIRLYKIGKYKSIGLFLSENRIQTLFFIGIILVMGFVRYYKRCHNIYQIVGGFIFGTICATVFEKIFSNLI